MPCRLLTFLLALACSFNLRAAGPDKPISRIAFGSCAHQDRPQPVWDEVVKLKPDLFLSLGDNIYGDTDDIAVLRAKYAKLGAVAGYQRLLKTCPVLATWDDHDYGKNDAGVEYPKKDESQQALLDFYGVPADSPRRKQKGVYHAETFGPPGKRLQVILLDGRYFRSPMKRGKREPGMTYTPYIANTDPDATILGDEQWKWLADRLREPAELRLLVSGIQVVAEDHGFEKWMNFPTERERLFALLKETKAAGVVCLSGDRHLAELSMMDAGIGYPLYDLTSSGLNQGAKAWRPLEKNRHRVATMGHGDNFGVVAVDWGDEPKVRLQIRDLEGDVVIQQKLLLSDLRPRDAFAKRGGKGAPDAKPTAEGAITPAAAVKRVGEKVTVEMQVRSVGGNPAKRLFLNSRANFRDEENLAVVLMPKAFTGKLADATGDKLKGKRVRVTGTVSTFKDAAQILVEDEGQVELVGEKK